MNWTESYKQILGETAKTLKGVSRRRFMAQIVLELGYGGQSKAEKELGWNRGTIRKGISEVTSGIVQVDNYRARGWKGAGHFRQNKRTNEETKRNNVKIKQGYKEK